VSKYRYEIHYTPSEPGGCPTCGPNGSSCYIYRYGENNSEAGFIELANDSIWSSSTIILDVADIERRFEEQERKQREMKEYAEKMERDVVERRQRIQNWITSNR
jgi:hypothetical protein